MSEDKFITPWESHNRLADGDEVEEMLEILIKIAQSERRDFLAYLLRMALIEARNHPPTATHSSH